MNKLLEVRHVRIGPSGPELSLDLGAGQLATVYGRADEGVASFLQLVAGFAKVRHGSIRSKGPVAFAGRTSPPRRATPERIAKSFAGRSGATLAAEALAATGLWDARKRPVSSLGPEELAASELLEVLAAPARVLVADRTFDRLDPWVREGAKSLLRERLRQGAAALVATHDPAWLFESDRIVVWRSGFPQFAGSPDELARQFGQVRLEIETSDEGAVRALCEPFQVHLTKRETGLEVLAPEGQALAARLLAEGYGSVKAVVLRSPTAEELLRHFR